MTSHIGSTRMTTWLEEAWLARYLDRELDSAEAAWFEAYALDKEDLLDRIDADTRLRQGVQSMRLPDGIRDANALPPFPRPATSHDGKQRPAPRRTFSPPLRGLALAASLVLGLGIGASAMRWHSAQPKPDTIGNPTRLTYHTMRGGSAIPDVEPGDSDSPYVRIDVILPAQSHNVVLHLRDASQPPAGSGQPGAVSFLIPRNERADKITYQVGQDLYEVSLKEPALDTPKRE